MHLTLQTDYALRALIYTGLKGRELSTIDEIAEHFDISKNHLMKVVYKLGRMGYLETVRGRGGGVRLLMEPKQIRVGSTVRDLEGKVGLLGCLNETGYCRIEHQCILRRAVDEATKAFVAVLDQYTLEDLIRPGRSLARLLSIDWVPPAASSPASA